MQQDFVSTTVGQKIFSGDWAIRWIRRLPACAGAAWQDVAASKRHLGSGGHMTDTTTLIARRNRALGTGAPLFYEHPLHIVRGEGIYLYDADGRRYVDMYNNVPCVGHANPRVVEAMARQQATLNVHSRYLHEAVVAFCERLAALQGPQIESVILSCSGTEANEVALRMARFATGKRGILCTDATYHGNSELVGSLTRLGQSPSPNQSVRAFPFPETFRPIAPGLSEDALCEAYLAKLDAAIADLQASGEGVAAMIVCSILANEGLPDIPAGFMARAAARVREAGGLVIADEVQAGYARTGHWWGYEVAGFTPDIVVTGKPMGAGLPLAATAASRALIETFRAKTRYFNTSASSPLQAAVGMAVLDEIEQRDLLGNVATVGTALKAALTQRKGASVAIGDVRGHGLFIGVELVRPAGKAPDSDLARRVINRLKDKGFLTSNAGAFANVVKIRPPLPFSQADAAAFLVAWDETIAELSA
jgi:4-aminobutyrate aminotransferase-like enzyme